MRDFQTAEWLRGNPVREFFFTLIFCSGIICLLVTLAERSAIGQTNQDNIQYNVVYDCPRFNDSRGVSGGRKFKVLRCKPNGMCDVFQINEYNPNGGFEGEMTKAHVLDDISRYRCVAPGGGNNARPQGEANEEKEQPPGGEKPQPEDKTGAVECPASNSDSKGKTDMERGFRGAIREAWEREPDRPGLDGKVTLTFQAFRVGAPHKYRPYADPNDAVGKMVYPVRATFTTCTDYHRSIEIIRREREFSCYKNTAGEWACTIIAAPNTNVRDKTQSIDKPRPK